MHTLIRRHLSTFLGAAGSLLLVASFWLVSRSPSSSQADRATVVSGVVAFGLSLVAAFYSYRKRRGRELPGRLDQWLKVHVSLSVVIVVAMGMHAALGAPMGLLTLSWSRAGAAGLWGLGVAVTGIALLLVYRYGPPRLARQQRQLLAEAERLNAAFIELLHGKSDAFRRKLDPKARLIAATSARRHWRSLRGRLEGVPEHEHQDFGTALTLLEQRDELTRRSTTQLGLTPIFVGLLGSHVVFSLLFLLLTVTHAVEAGLPPSPLAQPRAARFASADQCADCHGLAVEQWRLSPHAQAWISPVTQAMNRHVNESVQRELDAEGRTGALNATCMGCHDPIGTQSGANPLRPITAGVPVTREGITCTVCHGSPHAEGPRTVPFGTQQPPFPVAPTRHFFGPYGAGTDADPRPVRNPFHKASGSDALRRSQFCQACHEVTLDRMTAQAPRQEPVVRLQETYSEWARSSFASDGITCQSCHMGTGARGVHTVVAPPGRSFERAPPNRQSSDHSMTGVDYPFWEHTATRRAQQSKVADFLKGTVSIEIVARENRAGTIPVVVRLQSVRTGHDYPTGFVFEREVWLEVVAEDEQGRILFRSGHRDANGRLFDELNPAVWKDPSLYDRYLLNWRGRMVRVEPRAARQLRSDRTLEIDRDLLNDGQNVNGTPILDNADSSVASVLRSAAGAREQRAASSTRLVEVFLQNEADAVVKAGIAPGEVREATYDVPAPPGALGPVRLHVRLLFRNFAPYILDRVLGLPELTKTQDIFEVASASATIPSR